MNRLISPKLASASLLRTRIQIRYSSGSPSPSNSPHNHFNKTGEKPLNPADFTSRSYEYSQSGGDDMVAEQGRASFDHSSDNNPASQKIIAGKGNVVNPLELSPATPELSFAVKTTEVTKNIEREIDAKTGQGKTKKAKVVEKTTLDFK